MTSPLLRITAAAKRFVVGDATVRALDGVSLDLARGETLAVVGESGSGKTTLANLVLGIETANEGGLEFAGHPLTPDRPGVLRRRIGLVQQNPYSSLNPRKTIGQSVALPLIVHGIGTARERPGRVARLLERVGLPASLAERRPLALSGGQRQRAAIARALAAEPELLVLDEPTSSLDVSVQAHILRLLRTLQQELGLTYIFITHDLGVVRVIASRVAVMYRGRIVEEGPVAAIFDAPRHRYTNLLLASIPTVSAEDDHIRPDWPWDQMPDGTADTSEGCAFRARCPFAIARCAVEQPALTGGGTHRHACFNPAGTAVVTQEVTDAHRN